MLLFSCNCFPPVFILFLPTTKTHTYLLLASLEGLSSGILGIFSYFMGGNSPDVKLIVDFNVSAFPFVVAKVWAFVDWE